MKGIFRDIFLGRKGSVLIIVAVALVALLGIAALVVDAGLVYTKVFFQRADMQLIGKSSEFNS